MEDNMFKSNPAQTNAKDMFPDRELGPFGLNRKTWTKEEMETYVQLDHLYDKEQIIRQTATEIAKAAVRGNSERGNLSADGTARWSVILASCLVKYSKEAAENENFLNECTEEDDYFWGDDEEPDIE